MLIRDITEAEYKALDSSFDEKGQLVTGDESKWPTGELEFAERIDDRLIIRALPEKIENLKALLKLHRAGYPIPKINSLKKK